MIGANNVTDKKYYYAMVSVRENSGQLLIVNGDKDNPFISALSLERGWTKVLPDGAKIQLIRELPISAMVKIKEKLIESKYREIHGITNF